MAYILKEIASQNGWIISSERCGAQIILGRRTYLGFLSWYHQRGLYFRSPLLDIGPVSFFGAINSDYYRDAVYGNIYDNYCTVKNHWTWTSVLGIQALFLSMIYGKGLYSDKGLFTDTEYRHDRDKAL